MNDNRRIDQFNRELDRALDIPNANPSGVDQLLPEDGNLLQLASQLGEADFSAESHRRAETRAAITAQENTTVPAAPKRGFRKAYVFAGAGLVALLLLFIFREPALAAVGSIFGYSYITGSGFVPIEGTRVLVSPVAQLHENQILTVSRALATEDQTEFWVEFNDEAFSLEGAWLILPDGGTFASTFWNWPSKSNPAKGHLVFPGLPDTSNSFTLALPQGWRITLELQPLAGAQIPDQPVMQPYSTATVSAETEAQMRIAAATLPACNQIGGAELCTEAISLDEGVLRILMQAAVQAEGMQLSPDFIGTVTLGSGIGVSLSDSQGRIYSQQLALPEDLDHLQGANQTVLVFQAPVAKEGDLMMLTIPGVNVVIPGNTYFTIDLGDDPQPGQTLNVDIPLVLAGQEIHFTQAELSGDGTSSLRLDLLSDPLQPVNGILVTGAVLGPIPELDSFGYGFNGMQLTMSFELINNRTGAKRSGELTVPVTGADAMIMGPFQYQILVPSSEQAAVPQAVESQATFAPALTAEPLSLSGTVYDGRQPRTGDVLFTVWNGSMTELYAANPDAEWAAERVAVLPGRILSFALHADSNGIDYVAGETIPGYDGYARDGRVLSYRFGDAQPVVLLGPAPVIVYTRWSSDDDMLYFKSIENYQTGDGMMLWVLPLNCRTDPQSCSAKELVLPEGMWAFREEWDPSGTNRLALLATGPQNPYGLAELILADVDAAGNTLTVRNMSQSPQRDRQWLAWQPDGNRIYTVCAGTTGDPNVYDLCWNDIIEGQDQTALTLPEGFTDVILSPGGTELFGAHLNPGEGLRLEIRSFNMEEGTLATVGFADAYNQPAVSADGNTLAWVSQYGWELDAVNLTTGKQMQLYKIDSTGMSTGQVTAFYWVH